MVPRKAGAATTAACVRGHTEARLDWQGMATSGANGRRGHLPRSKTQKTVKRNDSDLMTQ